MDIADVAETLSAEPTEDSATFADSFLNVVQVELEQLYHALLSANPDPKGAAKAVYYLTKRIELARKVAGMLVAPKAPKAPKATEKKP